MTPEQQRAVAIARARKRQAESQAVQEPQRASPKSVAMDALQGFNRGAESLGRNIAATITDPIVSLFGLPFSVDRDPQTPAPEFAPGMAFEQLPFGFVESAFLDAPRAAVEFAGDVATGVAENPASTALDLFAQLAATRVPGTGLFPTLARFGAPVAGNTLGKEIDESLGLQEDDSVAANVLEATAEEGGGRVLGGILSPLGALASNRGRDVVNRVADSFGFSPPFSTGTRAAEEQLATDLAVSQGAPPAARSLPRGKTRSGETFDEALEGLGAQDRLSIFETTGQQSEFGRNVAVKMVDADPSLAALRERNLRLTETMQKKLSLGAVPEAPRQLSQNLQEGISKRFESLQKEIGSVSESLRNNRLRARVEGGDELRGALDQSIERIRTDLGPSAAQRVDNILKDTLYRKVDDVAPDGKKTSRFVLKDTITGDDILAAEAGIESLVREFNPSRVAQTREAGVMGDTVLPVLRGLFDDPEDLVRRQRDLLERREVLQGNPLVKAVGATDRAQQLKLAEIEDIENQIFKGEMRFSEVKNALTELFGPEVGGQTSDLLRGRLVQKVYNSATDVNGNLTAEEVTKVLNDEKLMNLLQNEVGVDARRAYERAELVLQGIDQSLPLFRAAAGEDPDLYKRTRRLFLPLMMRVALFDEGRRAILNIARKDADERGSDLLRAMTGESGKSNLEQFLRGQRLTDSRETDFVIYQQLIKALLEGGAPEVDVGETIDGAAESVNRALQ